VNISEKGIDLIKHFEGVLTTPYRCPAGYWTIGVGHLISYDDKLHSSWDRTLSDNEIESLLKKDLIKYENGVTRLLHPKQPTQLSLALALILAWDAFKGVQFVRLLCVVIKRELVKFF
jgi:GH24 family phage-related lysozyme (muramidase)